MKRIITLLDNIKPKMKTKHHNQLIIVVKSLLVMVGRKTTVGLSRWNSSKGGSIRTLTRFFESSLNWREINWQIIKKYSRKKGKVYLLGGDEVIVSKSGKSTYGIDRFYSSIHNKVIKSIAFLNISLIDVEERKAYPLSMEQITKISKDGCVKHKMIKVKKQKRKVGRPKGSGNKDKTDIELTPYLKFVKQSIDGALKQINKDLDIVYFVFDGAFGNNNAVQMVKQSGLNLISKLQRNSALYFSYNGEQNKRGAKKKYGDKIDYDNIPIEYMVSTDIDGDIETTIFQLKMIHKKFADMLNVVIIQKRNIKTKRVSNVNLYTTDVDLSYEKIIDYYSLRFQIEFVFRDAKQEWGLEDFMNRKEKAIHNWANLSVFMVNIAHGLRQNDSLKNMSLLDLKTHYHGLKYIEEVFKLLPESDKDYLKKEIEQNLTNLGAIHPMDLAA